MKVTAQLKYDSKLVRFLAFLAHKLHGIGDEYNHAAWAE